MILGQIESFHGKDCSIWFLFVYAKFHGQIFNETSVFSFFINFHSSL
jgi:hypothetical protein